MNDDFNGHGPEHDGKRPSLPPLSLAELQGLVEETINEQEYVRRHLETLEGDVREAKDTLAESKQALARIEKCVGLISDKVNLIHWMKANGPYLFAFFGGGFVCLSILVWIIWIITHIK